ncbi:MAG: hypothetical protein HN368_06820 [Spirochaetales bacterium]|nr:hypothetical protein [Spirochaetales bacterium]
MTYDGAPAGAAAEEGEEPRLSLQPLLAAELLLFEHLLLWSQLPYVLNITGRRHVQTSFAGGLGDIQIGSLFLGRSGSFSYQAGLSYSYPLGVGDRYLPRTQGYISGAGEHRVSVSGGITFLRDPAAIRFQSALSFGFPSPFPSAMALRRVELHGAVMLIANSIIAFDMGFGGYLDMPNYQNYSQARKYVETAAAARFGLIITIGSFTARIVTQKGVWEPDTSFRFDAGVGISWRI